MLESIGLRYGDAFERENPYTLFKDCSWNDALFNNFFNERSPLARNGSCK
jgi:hypothetical protein